MSKKNDSRKNMQEIPLMILTNERTQMKASMLLMLYKAASIGQLAYMDGMDPDTGEVIPLIVGLEPTADGKFNVFPLARIFNKVDGIPQYLVPDGEGSYIDYRIPDKLEPGIESVDTEGPGELEALDPVEVREEDRPTEESRPSGDVNGGALDGFDDPVVQ